MCILIAFGTVPWKPVWKPFVKPSNRYCLISGSMHSRAVFSCRTFIGVTGRPTEAVLLAWVSTISRDCIGWSGFKIPE